MSAATPSMMAALAKVAVALAAPQPAPYSVVRGDTLSSIAARNGTTWQELARLNGLRNPDRLSVGQRISLPARQAVQARPAQPLARTPAQPVPVAATPSTAASRMNSISARLHNKLNNPNLEAALLANFDRETGGRFDHATREVGGGGYGIPQYTGASLRAYRGWLASNKLTDSANSQIDYFTDVYMPSRRGYKAHTAPGAQYTREQQADWAHRAVFTPAHTIPSNKGYSVDKINKATQRHDNFMKNNLRAVDGVWQYVKTSAAGAKPAVELREGTYDDVKKVYDALTPAEKDMVTPGRTLYKDVPYTARRVAYSAGVPVGFADLYGLREDGTPTPSQNLTLAVSSAMRGRRIARRLVNETIEAAMRRTAQRKDRDARIRRVIWALVKGNDASARAAEHSGFTERKYDKPHGYRRFVKTLP